MLAAYEVSSSASPASIELDDLTYLGVPASYCVELSMVHFWIHIKKGHFKCVGLEPAAYTLYSQISVLLGFVLSRTFLVLTKF